MEGLLNKKKILITREASQAKLFGEKIEKHGGCPRIAPLLKIDTLFNKQDETIYRDLSKFDWIFFTSINGVNHFFKQFKNGQLLNNCRIAVVGHKTEEALKQYGLKAHFIPSTYNAETMAQEFIELYPEINNVLFVRGNLSRPVLLDAFTKHNIPYSKVIVYETNVNCSVQKQLHMELGNEIDFITFTSPSTVNAFINLVNNESQLEKAYHIPCFCIGTTTETIAIEQGFKKTYIPTEFTIEGMIDKMIEVVQGEED